MLNQTIKGKDEYREKEVGVLTVIYLDILRFTANKVLLLPTIMRTEETFVKPPQSKFRVEHNCTTPLIQTGNCHFKLYNLRIVLKTLKYSI